MLKQHTHIRIVREWCVSLGVLTAISINREEAEFKLAAYIPMLMADFIDAAFTADSLNHVAKACIKGFPTYPELHSYLSKWWREHRPMPPLLAPPPPIRQRGEPTPEEIAHIEAVVVEAVEWLRHHERPAEDLRPKPLHLTPEQLQQAYADSKIVPVRPGQGSMP